MFGTTDLGHKFISLMTTYGMKREEECTQKFDEPLIEKSYLFSIKSKEMLWSQCKNT